MVVMMVLAFLVSWLPYATLALTVVFNPDVQMSSLVKVVPIYMAKSSTFYNPMIYIYMNKQVTDMTTETLKLMWLFSTSQSWVNVLTR